MLFSLTDIDTVFAVSSPFYLVLGVLITSLSTALLCFNWKQRQVSHWRNLLGWCLVLSATPAWVAYAGVEFGVVYNLSALAIIAWLLCIRESRRNSVQSARPQSNLALKKDGNTTFPAQQMRVNSPAPVSKQPKNKWSARFRPWGRFLLTGIYCGIASCFLAIVLGRIMPTAPANQMALAAMIYPFIWAIGAVWSAYTDKLITAFIVFTGCNVICGWLIFGHIV